MAEKYATLTFHSHFICSWRINAGLKTTFPHILPLRYRQIKQQYDLKVHEAELVQARLKQSTHHHQLEEVEALQKTVGRLPACLIWNSLDTNTPEIVNAVTFLWPVYFMCIVDSLDSRLMVESRSLRLDQQSVDSRRERVLKIVKFWEQCIQLRTFHATVTLAKLKIHFTRLMLCLIHILFRRTARIDIKGERNNSSGNWEVQRCWKEDEGLT